MGKSDATLGRINGKFYARWTDQHGIHRRNSLGTSDKAKAQAALVEFNRAQNAHQHLSNGVTVGSIFAAYVEDRRAAEIASVERMESSWRAMSAHFNSVHPDQITDEFVKEYIKTRRLVAKDGTIFTELGHLRAALKFGTRKKWIAVEPYIPRPAKPEPKQHYLTKEQAARFIDAAHAPHVKLFITLAITTAARKSALLELTWDRVDFERGLINLRGPGKKHRNKGRAEVPINAWAMAALQDAKAGALSNYVIEWAGQKVASVKTGIRAAARKAQVYCTPHVLRHTAGVWMAEAGIPMSEIAQYMGHSNTSITEKVYARYSPDYLRNAAGALSLGGDFRLRKVG